MRIADESAPTIASRSRRPSRARPSPRSSSSPSAARPGAARLPAGAELLLCLRKGTAGHVVTGMSQGVFQIQDGPEGRVMLRDLGAIHFTSAPRDGAPDRIREDALRERLKGGATP